MINYFVSSFINQTQPEREATELIKVFYLIRRQHELVLLQRLVLSQSLSDVARMDWARIQRVHGCCDHFTRPSTVSGFCWITCVNLCYQFSCALNPQSSWEKLIEACHDTVLTIEWTRKLSDFVQSFLRDTSKYYILRTKVLFFACKLSTELTHRNR